MGKAFLVLGIGLVLGAGLLAGPAGAARHDRDCIAGGKGGADAGNEWTTATTLIDFDCTGEVRAGAGDSHDWFKVPAPVLGGGDRTIRVCPLSAGLNTDLDVFRQPSVALPIGVPSVPALSALPAGLNVGTSHAGAGCDAVTLTAGDNQAGFNVLIHVTRTAGDGLYNLRVL